MQLAVHTDFPAKLVQAIVDAVQQETYAKDEVIIRKRQPAAGLFFILEGQCKVTVPSLASHDAALDEDQDTVRLLTPGSFFGELSLATGAPVSASVVAAVTTSCYVLGVQHFELFKINFPDICTLLEAAAHRQPYVKLHPFLKPPPFFGSLSHDLIAEMVQLMDSCVYEDGETIFFAGASPDALFIVAQGRVEAVVARRRETERSTHRHICYEMFNTEEEERVRSASACQGMAWLGTESSTRRRSHDTAPSPPPPDAEDSARRWRYILPGVGSKWKGPLPLQDLRDMVKGCAISDEEAASIRVCEETAFNADFNEPSTPADAGTLDDLLASNPAPAPAGEGVSESRPSAVEVDSPRLTTPRPRAGSTDGAEPHEHHEAADQERVAKVFSEGDLFAHRSLLHNGAVAEVSARAVGRCELSVLSARNFDVLEEAFPELREMLEHDHRRSDFARCSFLSSGAELFAGVEDASLTQHTASVMVSRTFKSGEPLITLGTPSAGLFIVMSGRCNCLIPDPADPSRRKQVAVKGQGEHFGELSLLEPGNLTKADVVAGADDVQVVLLTPEGYATITREREEMQQLLLGKSPNYAVYNFFFKLKPFADASHETLQAIQRLSQRQKHPAGAIVQRTDAPCEALCFVFTGQLLATTERAAPVTLAEGDFFGGEAFTRATARQQVQAGTDVELLMLSAEDAASLAEKYPAVRNALAADVPDSSAVGGASSMMEMSPMLLMAGGLGDDAASIPIAQHLSFLQTSLVSMSKEFSKRLTDLEKASRDADERRERRSNALLARLSSKVESIDEKLGGDSGVGAGAGTGQGGKSFGRRRVAFSPQQQ